MAAEATPERPEARDTAPERALVLLAGALILAASSRVAVPLAVFSLVVLVLAIPVSGLIAWLSRFDPVPDSEDDAAPLDVPVTLLSVEPLPRPVRPRADA
jgi:hypothetical protein